MKTNFYFGKKVLITGGSSGIGFALASQIIAAGGSVCILARRESLLTESAAALEKARISPDQEILTLKADITLPDELNTILDGYKAAHSIPDIVINCAGVAHPASFINTDPEIFHWMMDVNYFGTVNVLKNLVPDMQKRRSGNIVNISSMAGFIGVYGYTAYSGSKYAVSGFSDVLRSEMAIYNIKVSVVFPPDTQTPQLEYESKIKPFVTKEVAGSPGTMSAEAVAAEVLKQVARGRYVILPGFEAKWMYVAQNMLGRGIYPVMDMMVRSAVGKLKFGK